MEVYKLKLFYDVKLKLRNFYKIILAKYKFSKNNKISFIILRNASKGTKQYNFTAWKFFSSMALVLVIVISASVTTTYYFYDRTRIVGENCNLEKNLVLNEDVIKSLNSINSTQRKEIVELKETLTYSAEYFDNQLTQVDELKTNLNTLVSQLNKESNSNIKIPITRSLDRNNKILKPLSNVGENNIYKDMLSDVEDDEISLIIKEQIDQYEELIEDVEDTLDYLECKPDFKPVTGIITSRFGYRIHPVTGRRTMHNGVDFGASTGTSVFAAGSGVVTYSGRNGEFGNVIVISHGYGYKSVYAHNNKNLVKVGDKVSKGDFIAEVGATGLTTGSHLHFEIHYNGTQINPLRLLDLK